MKTYIDYKLHHGNHSNSTPCSSLGKAQCSTEKAHSLPGIVFHTTKSRFFLKRITPETRFRYILVVRCLVTLTSV